MQPSFNNGWKTKPADRSFPWALPMAKVTMTFGQITLSHPVSRCLWDGLRLAFSQMLYGTRFPWALPMAMVTMTFGQTALAHPVCRHRLGLILISMGVAHG